MRSIVKIQSVLTLVIGALWILGLGAVAMEVAKLTGV